MIRYIMTFILFFVQAKIIAQDNNFSYKPFPVYTNAGKVVIAGDVNSFVYSNYYGKDVLKEKYSDAHSRPEYLVYELFKLMKTKNVAAIGKLYDTTFNKKNFSGNRMSDSLKNYSDIKFISKFRSGELQVIRYDFISSTSDYPYFAVMKKTGNKYNLTSDINVSDPFNLVGSFSPNNLPGTTAPAAVNTNGMTALYFVRNQGKIFFANGLPSEDYTAVYLGLDFYSGNSGAESDFLKKMQKAAGGNDADALKKMIATEDQPLLDQTYFNSYFYSEIQKIFKNYSSISALASIPVAGGKLLYFKYSGVGEGSYIGSIILKETSGKYQLALRLTDDDVSNVLQNVYIREAIYEYLKQR